MTGKELPLRVFRIHQRSDGLFETRNEFPKDGPLGVDPTMNMAIQTAVREAGKATLKGSLVVIEAQQGGEWKEVERVEAPIADKAGIGPAQIHGSF